MYSLAKALALALPRSGEKRKKEGGKIFIVAVRRLKQRSA